MTQQEMQIAVADWMGWKPDGTIIDCEFLTAVPPLTLDWIYECEERLSAEQARKYHNELQIVQNKGPWQAWLWHATKEQRLEALCRTLFPERWLQI